jgi:hypothetical protein
VTVPYPVASWSEDVPLDSKSMNLALYTVDGTLGKPNGIAWHAQARISCETITNPAGPFLIFPSSASGTQTIISGAGINHPGAMLFDSAGYWGRSSDGTFWISAYTFAPAVPGGSGDGVTPGGWTVICHFMPIANNVSTTIDGVGCDLSANGSFVCAGARQKLNFANDACAFFLDIQNTTTGGPWQPTVTIIDSSSTSAVPRWNATDSSGETPRFFTLWACISDFGITPSYGQPSVPAPYAGPYTSATTVGTTGSPTVNVNSAAGIAGPLNFLSNPPVFRASNSNAQSVSNNTPATVTLPSSADVDNYSGWTASTYTVQRPGLYLCHGVTAYTANSTGTRRAGLEINSTTYWGPGYAATVAGHTIATKTQIFSLQAGDTIKLLTEQNSGGALTLASADISRMFVAWLGLEGTPSTLWTPPDTTFRWAAGTPGTSLPPLFQQHLANDLGFLCSRPYLMAYQTQAQSGFADNTWNTVTLDTVAGIVHSDTGDNYSGWTSGSSNAYTAQVAGWYLVVAEVFATYPTGSGQSLRAGLLTVTSGGRTPSASPDRYQELFPSQATYPPGATAVGLYYLNVGETIAPQIYGQSYVTSGTWGTQAATATASHLEVIWVGSLSSVTGTSLQVVSLVDCHTGPARCPLPVRMDVGVLGRHLMTVGALATAPLAPDFPHPLRVD